VSGQDDALRRAMAWSGLTTATTHHPNTRSVLPTVPGIGAILRLVLRDDIPDSPRCPRVQAVTADSGVVTWPKDSAGKRSGTGGRTLGQASRTWAFAEAAVLCLRDHPAG
jgi:Transposase IS116/IS110/IS902 family